MSYRVLENAKKDRDCKKRFGDPTSKWMRGLVPRCFQPKRLDACPCCTTQGYGTLTTTALSSKCLAGAKKKSIEVGKGIFEENSMALDKMTTEGIPLEIQSRLLDQPAELEAGKQNVYIIDDEPPSSSSNTNRPKGDADRELGPGMLAWKFSQSKRDKPELCMSLGPLNTHVDGHQYYVKNWKGRLWIPLTGKAANKWTANPKIPQGKTLEKNLCHIIREQVFKASLVATQHKGSRGKGNTWSMFSEHQKTPAMVVMKPPELEADGSGFLASTEADTYYNCLRSGKSVLQALLNTQVSKIVCGAEGKYKGRIWSTREHHGIIEAAEVELRGICAYYLSEMEGMASKSIVM